jgi:hypothetical protein
LQGGLLTRNGRSWGGSRTPTNRRSHRYGVLDLLPHAHEELLLILNDVDRLQQLLISLRLHLDLWDVYVIMIHVVLLFLLLLSVIILFMLVSILLLLLVNIILFLLLLLNIILLQLNII